MLAREGSSQERRACNGQHLLAVGQAPLEYKATVDALGSVSQAAFKMNDGIALSNAGPLLGTTAPRPLNSMVGLPADQAFAVTLERAGVQYELQALRDMVLRVEYEADI